MDVIVMMQQIGKQISKEIKEVVMRVLDVDKARIIPPVEMDRTNQEADNLFLGEWKSDGVSCLTAWYRPDYRTL